ncbi:MAG: prephenate dehydratase [Bacillota bacterium]|nr:prephenate dehydratase [Bacillota bacterium]
MTDQPPVRIGYLGPEGTFSEEAARGRARAWPAAELVPLPSLEDVIRALRAGDLDEAVLPAENAGEGAVTATLDLLVYETDDLGIQAEMVLPVRHSLAARPGVRLEQVTRVLSHPQALGQCRGWLARHLPGAVLEETASTAQAAARVARSGEALAAVAAPRAAALHGLTVLAGDIADLSRNATRFLVLARGPGAGGGRKTSLVAALADRPGALYDLLGEFARRGINLSRIESRPARTRLGEYLFLIDIEGSPEARALAQALDGARALCTSLRVLGSYDVFERGSSPDAAVPNIPALRESIDALDGRLVELLARRTALAREIGRLKRGPVRDPRREREVIARVRRLAAGYGLDPETAEGVFRLILTHSVMVQTAQRGIFLQACPNPPGAP